MLPRPAAAGRSIACAIALAVLALLATASCRRAREAGAASAPRSTTADAPAPDVATPDAAPPQEIAGTGTQPTAGGDDGIDHSDPAVAAKDVAAKLAAEAADAAKASEGPTVAEQMAADGGVQTLGFDGGAGGGGGGHGGSGRNGGKGGGLTIPPPGNPTLPQNPNYGVATNSVGSTNDLTGLTQKLTIGDVAIIPSAVETFRRVELTVALTKVKATKPFDPDASGEGLDLSATFSSPATPDRFIVPGFWDGAEWRIRFAAPVAGAWRAAIVAKDKGGTDGKTVQFTVSDPVAPAPANPGWLRLESGQLRDAGHGPGNPGWFRGVGYNIGWQDGVVTAPGLTFAQMQAADINLLSFWLQKPWITSGPRGLLEAGGVGVYNTEAFGFIDGVVEGAEAARVRLLPSIWPHDALRVDNDPWPGGNWDENPYKALVATSLDFFTLTDGSGADTPQWKAQKNLYRYLVARWGYSPALVGWVALVEANGTTAWNTAAGKEKVKAWADAVRDWFVLIDPFRRSAEGYPLTVSLTSAPDDENFDSDFSGSVAGDLMNVLSADSYAAQRSDTGVAAQTGGYQVRWTQPADLGRLALITEFAGQVYQVNGDSPPYATQPAHLHNGLWAAIGGGATIAPLLWVDPGGFPFLTDATVNGTTTTGQAMRDEMTRVAAFDALADAALFGGKTLVASAVLDAGGAIVGFRAANAVRAVAWVRTASGANFAGGSQITFPLMSAGTYDATWFDTDPAGGAAVVATAAGSVPAGSPATLTLNLPGFATTRKDLAVLVVQQGLPPTSIVRAEAASPALAPTLALR